MIPKPYASKISVMTAREIEQAIQYLKSLGIRKPKDWVDIIHNTNEHLRRDIPLTVLCN